MSLPPNVRSRRKLIVSNGFRCHPSVGSCSRHSRSVVHLSRQAKVSYFQCFAGKIISRSNFFRNQDCKKYKQIVCYVQPSSLSSYAVTIIKVGVGVHKKKIALTMHHYTPNTQFNAHLHTTHIIMILGSFHCALLFVCLFAK